MLQSINDKNLFILKDGYRISKVLNENCMLLFKDTKNRLIAALESCGSKITRISPCKKHRLTGKEKGILHKFIRQQQYRLNEESAFVLDLTVLRDSNGNEEYLSERQLRKRLKERLEDVRILVGYCRCRKLNIPSFSRGCVLNLSRANIRYLTVGKSSSLFIDVRDNKNVRRLHIQEGFSGKVNLSRSGIESVMMANNCRCDLTINDSLNCFNLMLGDVYSGKLQVKNSCFHSIKIGFYCYADMSLSNNWGRRSINIGNSFRGILDLDNVKVYEIKIGKDCKGKIAVTGYNQTAKGNRLRVSDNFSGVLEIFGSAPLEKLEIGKYAGGQLHLLNNTVIKTVSFGSYYRGQADFSDSLIKEVRAGYGCSGKMFFFNCENLSLLTFPKDKNAEINIEKQPLSVFNDEKNIYYRFADDHLPETYFSPLYQRLYKGIKDWWSERIN